MTYETFRSLSKSLKKAPSWASSSGLTRRQNEIKNAIKKRTGILFQGELISSHVCHTTSI